MADDRLDANAITDGIRPEIRGRIKTVEILEETASTNDDLMRLPTEELHGRLLLAERQSAGKGRRGRAWHSPDGNIFMSLGWRFEPSIESLAALAPVVGVCVCQALKRFGLRGHGIKWPNDIMVTGAKVGGVLVETRQGRAGCDAVIGVGINMRLPAEEASAIGQPATDLVGRPGFESPRRNALIAALVEELLAAMAAPGGNLGEFIAASWSRWDLLEGRDVRVDRGEVVYAGRAMGITTSGALRVGVTSVNEVATDEEIMEFNSGEVSVRDA